MRNVLRVVAVLAAGVAAAASATAPKGPYCPPDKYLQNGQCVDPPPEPEKATLPPLRRVHIVEAEKPIDGFEIVAKPSGAAGWEIGVRNGTEASASLLWDESSFVASTGMAAGRLINGSTRKMDTAKAQPGSPIPPGAAVREIVFPEKFIQAEEDEAKVAEYRGQAFSKALVDGVNAERRRRYELIVGGKLYVTINTAAGKQTWVGTVVMPNTAGSE